MWISVQSAPHPILIIGRELGHADNNVVPEDATDGFETAVARRVEGEFAAATPGFPSAGLYDRLLAEVERPLINQALLATRGNQIKAAAILGINRNTLRKKIQALGLSAGRGD